MQLLTSIKVSSKKASFYSVLAMLALAAVIAIVHPGQANAGTLTSAFVRFDRLQASQPTTGTVCAKPGTAATEATVQVTFPTGYTLGAAGTFTVNTTNTGWPASAAVWSGIGTATNVTGQVVTFPSTDLASTSTVYCFNWTNQTAVTVKAGASSNNSGTITTRDSVPATIDTVSYSTQSMTSDQIGVSAQVPQTFSFALTGTSDNLGALGTGAVSTSASPSTVAITTNAATGWGVWAKDSSTGLNSSSTSSTIASTTPGSNSTLSAGTEGYNTGVTSVLNSGAGTITVAAPFVGGSLGKGGGLNTSMQLITSATGIANATLTLKNSAAINSNTIAATDYADTITVVGAGMF